MTTVTETPATEATVENKIRERRDGLNVSRSALAELTGLTDSALWRCEQGRGKEEELQVVAAALENVEKNGLPEHLVRKPAAAAGTKPRGVSKSELEVRLETVRRFLEEMKTKSSVKEIRALIEQCDAAATGTWAESVAG